ncbi:MAG TPA: redoxin domain-containing protein [Gemmatimonadaceae bacterium]|nr:redoxin domain-containing protein [Gemmatimonadaceae bacterium]
MSDNKTATPISVGATAPDFTLASTSGETVTLSAFRGNAPVLVAFFPLAFTSVCTTELCAFTDDFDQFAGQGVTILPVSVDAVPSLSEFKRKHDMRVDLLSDFKRDASRAFGVLREDTYFSNRAYFLIDRDGIVRWAHVEETPGQRRENHEILAAITTLAG